MAFRFLFPVLLLLSLSGCAGRPGLSPGEPGKVQAARISAEDKALYHFGLARLMAAEGDRDGALQALQKAISLDPHSVFLRLSIARLYLELEQEDQAAAAAREALARDPRAADAHLLLGSIAFNRGNDREATEHFRRAIEIAPDEEGAWLHLGVAYARAGELEKAAETLKGLAARRPDSLVALLTLARLYRETEMYVLAEETYRQILRREPRFEPVLLELGNLYEARKEPEKALDVYREVLSGNPDHPEVRHHIARLLISQERFDEAMTFLKETTELYPDDLEAKRKIGLIQLEKEQWSEAARTFAEILEADPSLDQIRYYLGNALERQERWSEAMEAFRGIGQDSDLYPDTLVHMAYVQHRLGRDEEAIAFLEKERETVLERPELASFLASLYESRGDLPSALNVVESSVSLNPGAVSLLYQKGAVLERLNRRPEAMAAMRRVLALEPDNPEALNYIAYTYAEEGRELDEALRMARKALAQKEEGHILDTVGWVHYQRKEYPEARRYLELAVKKLSSDSIVWLHLGDALRALGLVEDAGKAYGKALELDPQNAEIRKRIEAL